LEISPKLYPPYGIYQIIETPQDNNKISFKCDGSLVKKPKSESGADWKNFTKNVPNYYCETNGKDFLSQFEFQTASVYPVLTTGGDYGEGWVRVYIKKAPDLNYFLLGSVTAAGGANDYWITGDSSEKYAQLTKKDYLDGLLKNPKVLQSVTLWQNIAGSFRVETASASI
jgi:hypothetical protein